MLNFRVSSYPLIGSQMNLPLYYTLHRLYIKITIETTVAGM
jgi:hypothetical protein